MDRTEPFDPAAYAQAMAKALSLPLAPDSIAPVEANLAVAFRLAVLFLDFPLPDELEPAPVYRAMMDAP